MRQEDLYSFRLKQPCTNMASVPMDFFTALVCGFQPKHITFTSNHDLAMTDARGNITCQLEDCLLLVQEKPPWGVVGRLLTPRAISVAREVFLSRASVSYS